MKIKSVWENEVYSLHSPSIFHEESWNDCKKELHASKDEYPSDCSIRRSESFIDWLNILRDKAITISGDEVPQITRLLIRESDSKVCGGVNLRLNLNDTTTRLLGHIGYFITPSERGKGLGNVQMLLAMCTLSSLDINPIISSCDDNNIKSKSILQSMGGTLYESKDVESFYNTGAKRYQMNVYHFDVPSCFSKINARLKNSIYVENIKMIAFYQQY